MTFLISGTRTGIGLELSKKLLSEGHFVIGLSRGKSTINHDNYTHYQTDVGSEESVMHMIFSLKKNKIKIDVLINNAGIARMNHLFLTPINSVHEIFSTNFFGVFLLCREIGKMMSTYKNGRIINISSVASPLNIEGESVYGASKAAIENFSKTIAKELQSFGITVNTIGPGPMNTALTKNLEKDKITQVINRQIIKKEGTFNDVFHLVTYLASPNSSMITGHHFYIGGV